MDPRTMMNQSLYHQSSSSYNLSEIWSFPIIGSGDDHGRLEMNRASFGMDFSQYSRGVSESDSLEGQRRVKRKEVDEEEMGKSVSSTSGGGGCSAMHDSESKRMRSSGESRINHHDNSGREGSSDDAEQQFSKPIAATEPPKDYIHVRARRGQATDSHSLAERARREKISERMKILQDIVPGCNKVIGKAMVLDEIINYVQSLQRQVEFLSMKLEAVNSRMSLGLEGYTSKEYVAQQLIDPCGASYGSQPSREYGRGPTSPEWLHMQAGGGGGGGGGSCCFDRET